MALGFATMAAFQLMDYDVVFIKSIALNSTELIDNSTTAMPLTTTN